MHDAHPSIATDGLADGCPRCEEMADDPVFTLDDTNLENLVRRTKKWMDWGEERPRSTNELKAMRQIEHHLLIISKLNRHL
jgi:hypothetical protein